MRSFFDEAWHLLETGQLADYLAALEALHRRTPRWRWFKRYHMERQLRLGGLVLRAYRLGLRRILRHH